MACACVAGPMHIATGCTHVLRADWSAGPSDSRHGLPVGRSSTESGHKREGKCSSVLLHCTSQLQSDEDPFRVDVPSICRSSPELTRTSQYFGHIS
jgi:hypothetical protein